MVAAELDDFWSGVFAAAGRRYVAPAGIVWYDGQVATPCGATKERNATYCPTSKTIYVERSLFTHFTTELGLTYAIAIVLAHEWGHAVQDQFGLLRPVRRRAGPLPQLEWEADCLAGMWARWADEHALLGDTGVADGLALMIETGDAAGSPRYFGHGTSDQRAAHYLRGYATQSLRACERVLYNTAPTG